MMDSLRQRWTRRRFVRHTEQLLPTLARTARRLTRDPAAAEDLVHDTYVKAYQAYDKAEIQSPEACRAWLLRILVNTFRDGYRRQQRSPEVPVAGGVFDADTALYETTTGPEADPEVLVGHKRFAAAAQEAIAALSPEVRLVVALFFVEGLSYKEIADIADCPIGTVMSRLSRGRRLLQPQLQAYKPVASVVTSRKKA